MAPVASRRNPLTRSAAGILGLAFLAIMLVLCIGSLPWTMGRVDGVPRYNAGTPSEGRFPPLWVTPSEGQAQRMNATLPDEYIDAVAQGRQMDREQVLANKELGELRKMWPKTWLGTDALGRDMITRLVAGGGISLSIGLAAAALSVCIGTLYGAVAGYAGGRVDGIMMRIVDVLYGLPSVLLVVLLAVASDAMVSGVHLAPEGTGGRRTRDRHGSHGGSEPGGEGRPNSRRSPCVPLCPHRTRQAVTGSARPSNSCPRGT